jgi:tetratricopeptide (TPR) repeat protein
MDLIRQASALEVATALQRARQERACGRFEAAEAAYATVLQARPHLVAVELELARLRLERGDAEEAARPLRQRLAFGEGLGSEPEREQVEAVLLEALLRLERWAEAEPLLRRLRARGLAEPEHLLALARAVDVQGREEDALEILRQGLGLDPLALELRLELARRLRRLGRWEEALAEQGRALALAPERDDLHRELVELRLEALWQRGEACMAAEDWRGAARAFGALRELEPGHGPAGERLELLARLDPAQLTLAPTPGLESPADWRAQAQERLERFGRLLDRLEADGEPAGDGP